MKSRSYEIDMCNGPLLGKIISFAVPLMLSGVLQLLFNAADIIVVGQYAGSQSMAAVGSTSSLTNLLVNVFIGFSVGTNVLVARYYGNRNERDIEETVHTSILMALVGGLFLILVGVGLSRVLLEMMGTPEDVIELSTLYMRIIFVGMPASLVYNFGSAILRAVGDTKRPLYFLFLSGVINVVLNLTFVIVFHMGVGGVALSTIISQFISAILIIRCLMHSDAAYHLDVKRLRFVKDKVRQIIRIGLPAGLQGSVFSISNVLIQSSVNSFGSVAMAGNTAASNIEGFVYTCMNAMYQATITFASQNFGAYKLKRMKKVLLICLGAVMVMGLLLGNFAVIFGEQLLGIYAPGDAQVIQYGIRRLQIIGSTYFICGMMDTMVGGLRGMGYSVVPMIVSLTGACAFRVIWIFTVFAMPAYRSLETLYISYPISWGITLIAHVISYIVIYKKVKKKFGALAE